MLYLDIEFVRKCGDNMSEERKKRSKDLVHNMLVCWVIFMGVVIIIFGEMLARNVISEYVTKDTVTSNGNVLYDASPSYNKTIEQALKYLSDTYPDETFEVCGINEAYDIQVISDKYPDVKMSVKAVQYRHTQKVYFLDNHKQAEEWYRNRDNGIVENKSTEIQQTHVNTY